MVRLVLDIATSWIDRLLRRHHPNSVIWFPYVSPEGRVQEHALPVAQSSGNSRIEGPTMPSRNPITKAALERALTKIHPHRETAIELVKLGIYRIGKHSRLRNGKCGAYARSTGAGCLAPAMENGRCKLHGGLSTGPRTPEGRERISVAVSKANRERWERWRLEKGRPPGSCREGACKLREMA